MEVSEQTGNDMKNANYREKLNGSVYSVDNLISLQNSCSAANKFHKIYNEN